MSILALFRLADSEGSVGICAVRNGVLPALYDHVHCTNNAPDITSLQDVLIIGGNVVRILIALSGALAMVVIIVAAIYYVTSTGDPARIKRAKDILINMTIGLVLIISAYAIVTYIARIF